MRALVASLVSRGFASVPRAKAPSLPDTGAESEKPKNADYWLKGLARGELTEHRQFVR